VTAWHAFARGEARNIGADDNLIDGNNDVIFR